MAADTIILDNNPERFVLTSGGDTIVIRPQGGVSNVPKNVVLSGGVTVLSRQEANVSHTLDAGAEGAFTANGIEGTGLITVTGAFSAVTATTGVSTGTAGAGTIAGELKKPAGEDDWTADDFNDKLLRITSGAGSGAYRWVKDTTTDTIYIDDITGLDNTSVFEVVEPGTTINDLDLVGNTAGFKFVGLDFTSAVDVADCRYVQFEGCRFNGATAVVERCQRLVADNNLLTTSTSLTAAAVDVSMVSVLIRSGSSAQVQDSTTVECLVDATGGTSSPLRFQDCDQVLVGANSYSNTGHGLEIESCRRVEQRGSGWTGTVNTGYGFDVQGPSWVDATGSTVTGTLGDFRVGEQTDTYANLATEETIIDKGTSVVVLGG